MRKRLHIDIILNKKISIFTQIKNLKVYQFESIGVYFYYQILSFPENRY